MDYYQINIEKLIILNILNHFNLLIARSYSGLEMNELLMLTHELKNDELCILFPIIPLLNADKSKFIRLKAYVWHPSG